LEQRQRDKRADLLSPTTTGAETGRAIVIEPWLKREARGAAAGALAQTRFLVSGLQVNKKKMRENLDITKGLIMSEAVMMGLGAAMGRNRAHDVVYDVCREVVKTGRPLVELLAEHKEIGQHASRKQLQKMVDPANYLGVAGEMVDRVLKMRKK